MTSKIIDGLRASKILREECRGQVLTLVEKAGVRPGLAVILVGVDLASGG